MAEENGIDRDKLIAESAKHLAIDNEDVDNGKEENPSTIAC